MNTVHESVAELSALTYPRALEEYQHEGVIKKFRDEWIVDEKQARDIFSEMKKFLYVSEIGQQKGIQIEIDETTQIIDKMWHHFILFTQDYEIFCERFFGKMVHHAPFSSEHLAQAINDATRKGMTLDEYKLHCLEQQLGLIESAMGIETVRKWYVDYANAYSPGRTNALQRAVFHENMEHFVPPLEPEAAAKMSPNEMIQGILQHTSPSMFCGRRCGRRCGTRCRITCKSCRRACR